MAVGDCSVTERWRWRPPYQTGKIVHVHAKHYKHNEDGRPAPGVCGNGSVPLSHSGNVVTRIENYTHTHTDYGLVDGWSYAWREAISGRGVCEVMFCVYSFITFCDRKVKVHLYCFLFFGPI